MNRPGGLAVDESRDKNYPNIDPSSADLNTFSPRSTWLHECNLTRERSRDVRGNHAKLIRKLAAEATALPKNERQVLLLKAPKNIAIFGNDAGENTMGAVNQAKFEFGNIATGGHSVVASVAKLCNNTVMITLSSGINILPFAYHPNVTAILAAHYPGQGGGNSIVHVLYGDVNPSGHLPYTVVKNTNDYNAPPTTEVYWQSCKPVADSISSTPEEEPVQLGGNPTLWETIYNTTASVTNSGHIEGAAVPQLYVTFPDSTPQGTPPPQLRVSEKVSSAPGETCTFDFELMRRVLSYWDIVSQKWLIPEGEFIFRVGFSTRDLREITPVRA
ncbi:Glycoside hydrolase superfamily [Penicillium vulpinum]|uniref:Glycoside hydrolase superfamily n=1 Tax=Penicillium vulpinum TaxID=29845 RepID=UPI0025483880|nr:Glycoside hydrolase superfamily [Penicillium vulpinum]KAJ5971189.1 Glycoside hydrolase superfamily [Penicillium vulpinum]